MASLQVGFVLALLFGAPGLVGTVSAKAHAAQSGDTFSGLEQEYGAALKEWKAAMKLAKGAAVRRELRKQAPGFAFWPRFQALESEGDSGSMFWLIENTEFSGVARREEDARVTELYTRMIARYSTGPDYELGLDLLFKDGRLRSRKDWSRFDALVSLVLESAPDREARALIELRLALTDLESKDAQRKDGGLVALERLIASGLLPQDRMDVAEKRVFSMRHLQVGSQAPGFEGLTPDGERISLSDYEGRVVLLDFFGFW